MAENENQNVDIGLMDGEETITLTDDSGKPVKFVEEACVEYMGELYALLVPVEPIDGDDDGLYIFKVTEEDEDTDVFEFVSDNSVLEAVYNEYVKAIEAEQDDCCDCGCEHEHHHHHHDDDCCEHERHHHHDDGDCCGHEHHHHHHDGEDKCGCEHESGSKNKKEESKKEEKCGCGADDCCGSKKRKK